MFLIYPSQKTYRFNANLLGPVPHISQPTACFYWPHDRTTRGCTSPTGRRKTSGLVRLALASGESTSPHLQTKPSGKTLSGAVMVRAGGEPSMHYSRTQILVDYFFWPGRLIYPGVWLPHFWTVVFFMFHDFTAGAMSQSQDTVTKVVGVYDPGGKIPSRSDKVSDAE